MMQSSRRKAKQSVSVAITLEVPTHYHDSQAATSSGQGDVRRTLESSSATSTSLRQTDEAPIATPTPMASGNATTDANVSTQTTINISDVEHVPTPAMQWEPHAAQKKVVHDPNEDETELGGCATSTVTCQGTDKLIIQ